jgi:adenylate cyclase
LKDEDVKFISGKSVEMGDFIIPVKTHENHMLINYMWREIDRKDDSKKTYVKLSFHDALDMEKLKFYVEEGSIVLIGYDSSKDSETENRLDVFLNPGTRFPRGETGLQMPGVSVLIYSIRTILGDTYISQAGNIINSIVILIFGWISAIIFLRFASWKALVATVLLLLVCFIINCSLFFFGGIWVYLFHPFIVIILNFIIVTIYEVQRSRNIFASFLPKAVVEKVLTDHKALELGGEKKEVTIIFSDIRGYTDLSETLEPDQVLNLLNVFNVAMGDIIKGNKGTIFDYQGDAIMAVFGAPEEDPDHACHAVKAALGMQEKMKELADGWEKEGKPHVEIGIGVSTGIVAIGMMGTSERRQYVAIGDSTNVSARVQGKSKELESPVLITETTYEQAKDKIIAEPIGKPIEVKGKSKPLNLYRVTGINC